MFLEQPYKSKTVSHINESELTYLVNRYIIESYSNLVSSKKIQHRQYTRDGRTLNAVYLLGLTTMETEIPDLEFPLINNEKGWICFDLRRFYSVDRSTGNVVPKRSTDINFLTIRNDLTGMWGVGAIKDLYFFRLPHMAFANWVSSLIASKFGLDVREKNDINIVAYIYYSRLFNRTPEDREGEFDKLAMRLKESFYSRGMLEEIYNKVGDMETIHDFCSCLADVTGSLRLKDFNAGVLLRLTQTGWMGVDSKQNIALCLEFPPFWIAMCYSSLVNNVYKRTTIGDKVQTLSGRGEGVAFMKSVNELIEANVGG